jgi:hypothetical protein
MVAQALLLHRTYDNYSTLHLLGKSRDYLLMQLYVHYIIKIAKHEDDVRRGFRNINKSMISSQNLASGDNISSPLMLKATKAVLIQTLISPDNKGITPLHLFAASGMFPTILAPTLETIVALLPPPPVDVWNNFFCISYLNFFFFIFFFYFLYFI